MNQNGQTTAKRNKNRSSGISSNNHLMILDGQKKNSFHYGNFVLPFVVVVAQISYSKL